MVLKGNDGSELAAINCDVFNIAVVRTDDDGDQVVGRMGQAIRVKPDLIPNAPEDCPLTIDSHSRLLGHFAACKACSHATLVG